MLQNFDSIVHLISISSVDIDSLTTSVDFHGNPVLERSKLPKINPHIFQAKPFNRTCGF